MTSNKLVKTWFEKVKKCPEEQLLNILIKIVIAYAVFMFFCMVSVILTPPDVISQIALAVQMFFVFAVIWFIVSRFKLLAQTPMNIKILILVLVCLLSVTITSSVVFFRDYYRTKKSYHQMKIEHSQSPAATTQQQTQTQSQ